MFTPPPLSARPKAIVIPEMPNVWPPPVWSPISKTRDSRSPLTVSGSPGPSMRTERVGLSCPAERRIRPPTWIWIRSTPVPPAAQPFTIAFVFAAVIASLSVHFDASLGSRRLFTTIGFCASYAPMSQFVEPLAVPSSGRARPLWSTAMASAQDPDGILSMASLPARSGCVGVSPPFRWSEPRTGSPEVLLFPAPVSAQPDGERIRL